jgi:uncharacterized protein
MRKLGRTTMVCLALAGSARADEREAAALASKLARTQMPKAQFDKSMAAMFAQMQAGMEDQAKAAGRPMPPDFAARMTEAMHDLVPYDEMMDLVAGVWMKHFSVEEMKALVRFYESPLGRKLAEEQPEVARDTMGVMMPMIMERMPKVMEKLKAGGTPPKGK